MGHPAPDGTATLHKSVPIAHGQSLTADQKFMYDFEFLEKYYE